MTSISNGQLEVHYESVDDMEPSRQQKLLAQITTHPGPLAIVFVVGAVSVPKDVPLFWLRVTSERRQIKAMAIVSSSLAVRAAASSFGVSTTLRGLGLSVRSFRPSELRDARAWCETSLG